MAEWGARFFAAPQPQAGIIDTRQIDGVADANFLTSLFEAERVLADPIVLITEGERFGWLADTFELANIPAERAGARSLACELEALLGEPTRRPNAHKGVDLPPPPPSPTVGMGPDRAVGFDRPYGTDGRFMQL